MEYNERYIAYAKAHGRKPEEMLKYDKKRYPGGPLCGCVIWINKNKRKFLKTNPSAFVCNGQVLSDQDGFTAFLFKQKE